LATLIRSILLALLLSGLWRLPALLAGLLIAALLLTRLILVALILLGVPIGIGIVHLKPLGFEMDAANIIICFALTT
jgi:hypothetical protein